MTQRSRAEKINVIRQFPSQLRQLVAPLSDKQLTTAFLKDEWTVAQIVHHCADSHVNSYVRLKLILTEDNPPIKPYAEPDWAMFEDASSPNLDATLSLLDGLHERWTHTLDRVEDDQWDRAGQHADLGAVSVSDLVDIYDNHCRAHLDQIRRVLAAEASPAMFKLRRRHVKLMRNTIIAIENLVAGLDQKDATTWRDGGDGWTVVEVLCHLRDFDGYFQHRIALMLDEDNPQLPSYDHDQIALDGKYNYQQLDVVLAELKASRQKFVELFFGFKDSAEIFTRPGIHPEADSWSIHDSLIQVGHHDVDHLQQMTRIIAEKR